MSLEIHSRDFIDMTLEHRSESKNKSIRVLVVMTETMLFSLVRFVDFVQFSMNHKADSYICLTVTG